MTSPPNRQPAVSLAATPPPRPGPLTASRGQGGVLWHARRGAGPPLLMAMGVGASSAYWPEELLAALERDFELILYDHPGTGRSPRRAGPCSVADLARDARDLLAGLAVGPAHVLGFSLGGMVAQELALNAPEAVGRLVLAGTSAGGAAGAPIARDALLRLERPMMTPDPTEALRLGLEVNTTPAAAADPALRRRWARTVASHPLHLPTVQAQLAAVAAHDTASRLAQLHAPALVLHGAEDQVIDPRHARSLAGALAESRLELLEGAGHLFFWQQPARTAALVREWLLAPAGPARPPRGVPS